MENKFKDVIKAIIMLCYIITLGYLIFNHETLIFKEKWLYLLNIVLLGIGFYHFVMKNSD